MSILDPESLQPIDTWVMTASDDDRGSIETGMMTIGGSIENVKQFYKRRIKVHGVIRDIRGRMEVVIRSPRELEEIEHRLNDRRKHPGVRRVSGDELAAIAALDADPKNWRELGGIRMFDQPSDEDLPDYPPKPPAKESLLSPPPAGEG